MKLLLSLLILALVSACQSTPVKKHKLDHFVISYDHAEFGNVKLPDPRWKTDRENCKKDFYDKGVISEGVLIQDNEKIKKLEWEYTKWDLTRIMLKEKKKAPSRLEGISKLDNGINTCLKDKGWGNRQSKAVYKKVI
ncbi:MAG: hypothetical protein ACJAZ3_002061 [Sphingobacteriales bacterium]|jgi:hypothetical protein